MKRSQMLDILTDTIKAYTSNKINHPKILANIVLKTVEKEGILPPKRGFQDYHEQQVEDLCIWEEE